MTAYFIKRLLLPQSALLNQSLPMIDSLAINDTLPEVPGDTRSDAKKNVLLTTQLAVATSIGILSFLLFCFLRPRWNTLFAPRTRLKGCAPDWLPDTFFGWVIPLIRVPESEVLDRVGLDAAVLLGFFKMSYKLFGFCALFALFFITPINIYDRQNRNKAKDLFDDDPVTMPNEQSLGIIFSYVVFTWIFSLATFYFMYYNYRTFVEVRRVYYLKLKDTLVARTVMVSVIPKELQTDRALAEFYESLGVGNVESAVVCRHVRKLRHAIQRRAHYLNKLEKAYAEWLGNPCTHPNYDQEAVLNELENTTPNDFGDNETGPLLENTPSTSKIGSERPTMRDGFLHIFGKKIDKIDYYTKRFNYYDNLVEQGRRGKYTPTSVGFVTFENFASAQIAAQTLNHSEPFHCQTKLAPEPRDVFWDNINFRARELVVRDVIVNGLLIILVFFWSGPISFFASLLNLDTLAKVFPWLADLAEKSEILKALIQGSLPTLAVSVFNALLPVILDYLSKVQGLQARSLIELSTLSKFFFFLLVNVLLIFTIAGTLFKALEEIITEPTKIARILASTLPTVAPFFVNFVILEGIGLYPLQLLQFGDVVSTLVKRLFFAKTPREYAEATTPPFLNYGVAYPRAILIFIIILVYSAISPNILFFGAIYFFLGYFTFKYLLLYVYFHPYESAGESWPLIFRRVIVGIYIFQLMMFGFLILHQNYVLASTVFPLLILTFVFAAYVSMAFNRSSAFLPLKLIRDEQNKLPTNTTDTAPYSQATLEPPNTGIENKTKNPDDKQDWKQTPSSIYQRHREILDDDLYHAEPDLYTDYTQPPMTLYPGVLNTGMRRYGPPALMGILPWVWLPVKRSQADIDSVPGFFRGLLGMHTKGPDAKPYTIEGDETPSNNRSVNGSNRQAPVRLHRDSQHIADERIHSQDETAQEDPTNPHKTYYHHPEKRPTKPIAFSAPTDVPSTSSTSNQGIFGSPDNIASTNQQDSHSHGVGDILENWAGQNFGDDPKKSKQV
ncbi:hypothetical protein G9A89_011343 [Geosiphon pyriformis]|nr:hypothetical protein G9A89_011343 [Geosiphon pyriformis]